MADNRSVKSTSKSATKLKPSEKSQNSKAVTKNEKTNRANEDRRKQTDRRVNADRRATQERRDTGGKAAATSAKKPPVKSIAKPASERTTEKGFVKGKGNETKNHSQVAAVRAQGADSDKKLRKTSKREPGSRKPGTELTKAEQKSKK